MLKEQKKSSFHIVQHVEREILKVKSLNFGLRVCGFFSCDDIIIKYLLVAYHNFTITHYCHYYQSVTITISNMYVTVKKYIGLSLIMLQFFILNLSKKKRI